MLIKQAKAFELGVLIIYRKVIVSGDIMEIYEYEREPRNNLNFEPSHDDFEAFDLSARRITEEDFKECRKDERRLQTTRDARNLTRRLALMNFSATDKFITLTYAENMQDLERADNDFKNFIGRFKYRYKIKGMKYIAVREKQKRGALHFHMLCSWDVELEGESHIRELERFVGEKVWGHGFVDIKEIGHVDNVGAYLIKYMTKNLSLELYKNKKLYLCSQGLKRPFEYKKDEAEAIIKYYELDNKKEVFTNSYESEYLGKIIYKEFNLNR